jgi:hypothetical protein
LASTADSYRNVQPALKKINHSRPDSTSVKRRTIRGVAVGIIFPCAYCGAPDSRDEKHQQGCPRFAPLSDGALLRLARRCEQGWAEDARRRAEAEQEEARAAHIAEMVRSQSRARMAYARRLAALRDARRRGAA